MNDDFFIGFTMLYIQFLRQADTQNECKSIMSLQEMNELSSISRGMKGKLFKKSQGRQNTSAHFETEEQCT